MEQENKTDRSPWKTVAVASLPPGWLSIRRAPNGSTTDETCACILLQLDETGNTRCVFGTASGGLIVPASDDPGHLETRWRRP
jgi:hypothetical protein